jgi:lipoyl(octanoyl) transferase
MQQMTDRPSRSQRELWVCQLGCIPYLDALALQRLVAERRHAGELPDTLLLLEHPPVYTRGRRSLDDELPRSADFYRASGIDVIDTDRGGRLTYHAPGQLVGYPIMRIADVSVYLRTMEAALVAALDDEGIAARSRCAEGPDYTGVWVGERKLASIGVHVSRAITTHGFAVNVENDLAPFSWVIACGLPDVRMTSIALELGPHALAHRSQPAPHAGARIACFRKRVAYRFAQAHALRQRLVSPRRLGIDAPPAPASRRARIEAPRPRALAAAR